MIIYNMIIYRYGIGHWKQAWNRTNRDKQAWNRTMTGIKIGQSLQEWNRTIVYRHGIGQ
jgi:hypothetical protein